MAYSIAPIINAVDYLWSYSGSGATLTTQQFDLQIDLSASATSGLLTVIGQNGCGTGIQSPSFPINVKIKPTVSFSLCNTISTTKNGRPIKLKGGVPLGSGGVYSGTGVTMVSPEIYTFDPASSSVIGGTPVNGIDYPVTYRYTNSQGCSDSDDISIVVYKSNDTDPCPGTMKDLRDGKIYPTFLAGTGANGRCWMAANLDYGAYTDKSIVQTDNCIIEKYCENNQAAKCDLLGGLYQWNEIMEYVNNNTFQDICPPGWHAATSDDWDHLISVFSGNGIAGSSLQDLQSTSGFRGILGGICYLNNTWAFTSGTPTGTMYWTSNLLPDGRAIARGLNSINPSVSFYPSSGANAFSVRCVQN